MKKIIIFLFFLCACNLTNAFAITLGNSIGINFGFLRLETKEKNFFNDTQKDSNIDIGFFYKYNWNIHGVIIGIEFFYDYLNLKTFFNNNSTEFRYRYGTNFNIGYDITDNFSIYGIFGYGLIKYRTHSYELGYKVDETRSRPIYGVGTGYSISDTWKIGLEYTIQTMDRRIYGGYYNFKNRIETIDISVIYKF